MLRMTIATLLAVFLMVIIETRAIRATNVIPYLNAARRHGSELAWHALLGLA